MHFSLSTIMRNSSGDRYCKSFAFCPQAGQCISTSPPLPFFRGDSPTRTRHRDGGAVLFFSFALVMRASATTAVGGGMMAAPEAPMLLLGVEGLDAVPSPQHVACFEVLLARGCCVVCGRLSFAVVGVLVCPRDDGGVCTRDRGVLVVVQWPLSARQGRLTSVRIPVVLV